MSDKKIIKLIIIGLVVLAAIVVALVVWLPDRGGSLNGTPESTYPEPEFLSSEEQTTLVNEGILDVSDDTKVQVLSRDENGAPLVFKIINSNDDIIANPSDIAPISPQAFRTE